MADTAAAPAPAEKSMSPESKLRVSGRGREVLIKWKIIRRYVETRRKLSFRDNCIRGKIIASRAKRHEMKRAPSFSIILLLHRRA